VLFVIDRRPLQAELAQAEAAMARDEAQARNAAAQAARYADLVKKDFVTREEYDRVTATAASARATVAADRAVVENARVQLSYTEIRSPMNGRTGSLMVHAGNLVRANDTTPLVVINQISPIRVTFSVPQENLGAIGAGRSLSVKATAPQGREAQGTLSFIDNAVNQSTGTVTLKATFANSDRALWPGQFVNVSVALSNRAGAFVIPTRAVQSGQRGTYVYVVKSDQQVEMRPIKVERDIAQETIVASGLTAGETVVTDGQLRLTPKSKVSVKQDLAPQKGSAS
jgi:multidrug efflux system membrane fusion protein